MTLDATRQLTKSVLIDMAQQFQCHKNKMFVQVGYMCIQKVNLMVEQKFIASQVIRGTKTCQKCPQKKELHQEALSDR